MKQLVHLVFLVCQCQYYTTTPFHHFLANTPSVIVSSLWLTFLDVHVRRKVAKELGKLIDCMDLIKWAPVEPGKGTHQYCKGARGSKLSQELE